MNLTTYTRAWLCEASFRNVLHVICNLVRFHFSSSPSTCQINGWSALISNSARVELMLMLHWESHPPRILCFGFFKFYLCWLVDLLSPHFLLLPRTPTLSFLKVMSSDPSFPIVLFLQFQFLPSFIWEGKYFLLTVTNTKKKIMSFFFLLIYDSFYHFYKTQHLPL